MFFEVVFVHKCFTRSLALSFPAFVDIVFADSVMLQLFRNFSVMQFSIGNGLWNYSIYELAFLVYK